MSIQPVNINNTQKNIPAGHDYFWNAKTSKKDKYIISGTTLLGTATACAALAKHAGYSLKPSKMFKNIKKSYLAKVEFEMEPVIALGAGSCLGGLTGGYLTTKDKQDRKAINREAVLQFGNISIPIVTVGLTHKFTQRFGKITSAFASIGAVFVGVYLANYLMNKLGNSLFHNKDEARKVKTTDFSAHLDDFVLAATYISKSDLVHAIGRFVPFALMIPGNEIGNKRANK